MCPPARHDVLGGVAVAGGALAGCVGSIFSGSLDVTTNWPRVEFNAGATGHNPDVTGPETEPSVRWEADAAVDSH